MKSLSGRLDRLEASLQDRALLERQRDICVPWAAKAFQLSESQVETIFWRTMSAHGPMPETMNEMFDELVLARDAAHEEEALPRN